MKDGKPKRQLKGQIKKGKDQKWLLGICLPENTKFYQGKGEIEIGFFIVEDKLHAKVTPIMREEND